MMFFMFDLRMACIGFLKPFLKLNPGERKFMKNPQNADFRPKISILGYFAKNMYFEISCVVFEL